ncbi:hypothetical protein [Geobacillus sp. B4113_201601]|uniref:hypothetical protein n=1 Tax=Geobacillus sp. B4113_201601 TaxID=1586290 RepID=UPI00128FF41E|nr:hypothetical protein [Geobacillus sp. B4113_201601]
MKGQPLIKPISQSEKPCRIRIAFQTPPIAQKKQLFSTKPSRKMMKNRCCLLSMGERVKSRTVPQGVSN